MSDTQRKPHYTQRPVTTPVAGDTEKADGSGRDDPFLRPAKEDDDGYDPFSDRPPAPEAPFQEDPWR